METKICKDCKIEYPTSNFHKKRLNKKKEQTYSPYCKSCHQDRAAGKRTPRQPYIPPLFKVCIKCKVEKSVSEFWPRGGRQKGQVDSYCKPCANERKKIWDDDNKYRRKLVLIKNLYGIDEEEYVGLINRAAGRCESCGDPFIGSWKDQMNVDHNHTTGVVRGMLCSSCNIALGLLKEDEIRIEKLLSYLRRTDGTIPKP
jgi:hypothetical protein